MTTSASFAQGLVGVVLDGRYRLDAVIGEGGMGSVFRATQLAMDRKVAIKLLKPHLTSNDAALQRFAREARATRKVESEHAVKILDFGVTPRRDYYMVLEYLDGRTVQRELEVDGTFSPARVVHIARQALDALATAHDLGVIHRDIKPDNLLLMRAGDDPDYTKILDFGVAKLMQGAAGDPALLALTAKGVVFGTPEFMSPEQACGQALDGRSDLYSLAVTMFVMLTGTALFEASTAIAWLTHHVRTPAPRLAAVRPALAAYPALDDLLQRCLAKRPEERPAGAAEMAVELAELAPTLTAAPAIAREVTAAHGILQTTTRVSSYVDALREPALTGDAPVDVARARRRLYVGIGGALAAAAVSVAISFVLQRPTAPATARAGATPLPAGHAAPIDPTADPASPIGDAGAAAVAAPDTGAGDAPEAVAAVAVVEPPRALAADPPPATVPRTAPRATSAPRNAEAEAHLRSAEDAFRANNRLRQLAEADLALRAEPRSVRAKYLLADALLKGGDLDRGCAYLRAIKRSVPARARAHAAGCPDD